ncbi:ABC transporter substrate-binding protein [Streptomyces acidiscabies]|uniref:ABC transporter substrate-binding protein n=1 Tax=Streptomyces acidiscabies TaxID=42234 RepID=A0AAP6EDJ7_9ACTN|nr:ABC transporter substrate-binding protein [Streptomyces acidiscabies]MBP5940399.1 carbohydrate ABC transporter substrate-binding protein [Streptomyces sp. LBUM 1476]MBZ3911638.1 carbohydrate ABC transporter substrate-binding protein [Streptomyces acidiscabies]MDX2958863.1 ABC transporter substrate-binding protein [Streptomyces acidiscabies]MDX3018300.1 ABC transporter substrate-binding protein [Streptomyces acidiscabies]MDX3791698.1 ABC transporter substrate-binding protein [Streptomyces ac
MSRRRLLGVSLGGVGGALLGLSGCGASSGSASAGTDHLSLWYWKGALSEKLLATARSAVPGVPGLKVRGSQMPSGEIDSKVRTSLAARAYVPDITVANSDNLATFFPDEHEFLDLRDYGAEKVRGQYLDWKWKSCFTPSGRMIGFPLDAGPTALYYRRDLFQKAGIAYEPADVARELSTWEKYIEAGRKLRAGNGPYLVSNIGNVFQQAMLQSTKQFVDSDNRFIGDQAHVRRAWDTAVEILKQGLAARISDGTPDYNAAMNDSRIATMTTAVWAINGLKDTAPKSSGLWRLTTMPNGPANYGGSYMTLTRYCREPERAFAFLAWLLSPANQLKSYQESALFPTTPAAYANPAMHEADLFFGGQRPIDVFGPAAQKAPVLYFSPYEETANTPFFQELTNVQTLGKNPERAWRDAVSSAESALVRVGVS